MKAFELEKINSLKIAICLAAVTVIVFLSGELSVSAQVCASPGNDNPATVSGVVNTYYPSPATASASGTSIPVSAVSNSESASTPIAAGDLLLIIQMQDATINTNNGSKYGSGVSGQGSGFLSGGVGNYEYVVATNSVSASGGTITISTALTRTYNSSAPTTSRGKQTYQVVRVPQYSSATVSGTLRAALWDGTSGGIVVLDVAGTLNMGGGTISAAGKGFRGGLGRSLNGGSGANTDYRVLTSNNNGGSKGEGIVGTPRYVWDGLLGVDTGIEGYPSGANGRGAPGNAGGGSTDGNPSSNDQNSGGGGGGNGGDGGQGGNSWSSNLNVGGVGGADFSSFASANRLVMGGGGGAGTSNNAAETSSSGASGGGIVLIRAGAVSGSGTINVNGDNAQDSSPNCCGDGAGGGGAGGSIIVTSSGGGLTGITALARGGKGGNTLVATSAHGPGGGGGGGVILANGSLGSTSVTGGANGTTVTSSNAYNAASGSSGIVNTTVSVSAIPGILAGSDCLPSLTVVKTTSTPTLTNTTSGIAATYKITVSNLINRAAATGVVLSDALPQPVNSGFTYTSTGTPVFSGGAARPTTSNPTAGATAPAWGNFVIPGGGSVALTFVVTISSGVPSATYQNPAAATYLSPTRTASGGTASVSYNPASSTGEDITLVSRPNVALLKSCTTPSDCTTASQIPGTDLTFKIQFTNSGGQSASNVIIVDGIPLNMDFKIGSAAVNIGTTGLSFAIQYSNDYDSANPMLATWIYTPVSGAGGAAAGYDRLVKAVRWRVTAGSFSYSSPNNTGDVSFTARIR